MFPETIKILVVDDMPAIRDLVKSQLRVLNYRNVVEAGDGEAGFNIVSKAMESGAPVDLIISDWNMPKMTGLEFLKQVRASAQLSKTPFLLLTSESEREQVTEAILAGVSQYIVKPFAAKSFEDKLRTVWNKVNQGA
jgi:two-component system, chemotaxis family, chemotaxis protein CheY